LYVFCRAFCAEVGVIFDRCMSGCMCVLGCACVCVYVCLCLSVFCVCVCVCVCVFAQVYAGTHVCASVRVCVPAFRGCI